MVLLRSHRGMAVDYSQGRVTTAQNKGKKFKHKLRRNSSCCEDQVNKKMEKLERSTDK